MTDQLGLRRVLGRFATGVSVVTTAHAGEPHGLTVNSFASLSLEPPQVIVCLKRANRSFRAFESATHFAVNVLADDQVVLARLFATTRDGKFDSVEHTTGPASGAPLIARAHAWLECAVAGHVTVPGTHTIVIGRLLRHEPGEGAPLIFHEGAYRRLGASVS